MLLINGNQILSPNQLAVTCLPRQNGGLVRELEAAWENLPVAQAAAILGHTDSLITLTFTDPVTGARQTKVMTLVSSFSEWSREGAMGAVFRLVRLTLREA